MLIDKYIKGIYMEERLFQEALAEDLQALKPEEIVDIKISNLIENMNDNFEFYTAIISNNSLEKYGLTKGQKVIIKKIQIKSDSDNNFNNFMESMNNELVVLKLEDIYFVRHCQSNSKRSIFVLNNGVAKNPSIAAFSKDKIMNILTSIFGIIIGTL